MPNLKLPNLLLLGAQKSASTYLSAWINNHSDIYIKSREDSSFENPEYQSFDINSLKSNVTEVYYGIRRPDYFGNMLYQGRVHEWLPNSKIIIVLRNPIERAFSAYYHYMKYGIIPAKNANYIHKIINGTHNTKYYAYNNILEYGKYFKLITNLKKYYDSKNILILKQENINKDETFMEVAEFLNISKIIPKRPNVIPQKSIYNLKKLKIRAIYLPFKNTYDENYSKSYSRNLVDLNPLNRLIVKTLSYVEKKTNNKSKQKETMSDELRLALLDYYKEDIIKFNKLGLIDVSNWLEKTD